MRNDTVPGIVLGRLFLKMTRGIFNFSKRIMTIHPDCYSFHDDTDNSDNSEDDWDAILEEIDFGDIPKIDWLELPPYVCSIRKNSKNKEKTKGNYKMTYSDEGPSLNITQPLTQKEMTYEALEKDILERITILQESRAITETLKYGDQHKKLLDSVLMDKLKLDEEVEEEAAKEVIRNYKTLREKNDPVVFVLHIRIGGKYDTHALADIGSNINILTYGIYEKIGKGEDKPIEIKIKMLDHSKAKPMGILTGVLCQVGVTIILARFLILNSKDVPIVMGRSFLYTCGGIINTIKGTTSTFDGVCHKKFPMAALKNKQEKKDSDDKEEIIKEKDKNGNPFYDLSFEKYLDCDNPMDQTPPFKKH
nr:hypothetical protein [Tanacetum cinerariifolium]